MNDFPIPVVAFGPGSQPEEESVDYLPMPQGMNTFHTPRLPETADEGARQAAAAVLDGLAELMTRHTYGDANYPCIDMGTVETNVLALVNDSLGEGEVSALANYPAPLRLQESAFPGVWRVRRLRQDGSLERDTLEACGMPAAVMETALAPTTLDGEVPPPPAGVMNAPALLQEVRDVAARHKQGDAAHIINLTLLPVTPADLDYLVQALGAGSIAILSRGYGNCRISSTGLPNVWWVQYFNSMDLLILNTIEIVAMPEVALAAEEDYRDSIERLQEWTATLRDA